MPEGPAMWTFGSWMIKANTYGTNTICVNQCFPMFFAPLNIDEHQRVDRDLSPPMTRMTAAGTPSISNEFGAVAGLSFCKNGNSVVHSSTSSPSSTKHHVQSNPAMGSQMIGFNSISRRGMLHRDHYIYIIV